MADAKSKGTLKDDAARLQAGQGDRGDAPLLPRQGRSPTPPRSGSSSPTARITASSLRTWTARRSPSPAPASKASRTAPSTRPASATRKAWRCDGEPALRRRPQEPQHPRPRPQEPDRRHRRRHRQAGPRGPLLETEPSRPSRPASTARGTSCPRQQNLHRHGRPSSDLDLRPRRPGGRPLCRQRSREHQGRPLRRRIVRPAERPGDRRQEPVCRRQRDQRHPLRAAESRRGRVDDRRRWACSSSATSNGTGDDVRLQHALGVAYRDGKLYVADTYNSKIKVIDPATRSCTTFVGGEQAVQRTGRPQLRRRQALRRRHEQPPHPGDRHDDEAGADAGPVRRRTAAGVEEAVTMAASFQAWAEFLQSRWPASGKRAATFRR